MDEELHYGDVIDDRAVEGWWSIRVTRLGDGYLAASRNVTDAVRARQAAAEARAAHRRERDAVHLLQQFALPLRLPTHGGVDMAAAHLPAGGSTPLGGDWYDAFTLADGRIGLVIGDVAGHGRDAAEAMIAARRFIGGLRHDNITPGTAMAMANDHLAEHGDAFVTCCYAVLDTAAGRITVASAGHLPPILRDDHGARPVPLQPGVPLGALPRPTYLESVVEFAGPAVLVLYTDGLIERRGENIADSVATLTAAVDGCDADAASTRDLLTDRYGHNPDDDAALIVAAFTTAAPDKTPLRDAPARPATPD